MCLCFVLFSTLGLKLSSFFASQDGKKLTGENISQTTQQDSTYPVFEIPAACLTASIDLGKYYGMQFYSVDACKDYCKMINVV